jgi:FkbM family methyltransferase
MRLRELLRVGRCGPVARTLSVRAARLPLPGAHLIAFGILGKPRRRPAEVEVERDGLRWALDLRDDAHRLLFLGLYETELRARVLERLPRGGTFVDVGANVGFWSVPAALRAGPEGRVVAFEPNPWALARLRLNADLNAELALAPLDVRGAAAGAEEAELDLYSYDLESGASQATLQRGAVDAERPERVTVPVVTLAGALDGQVDVLKIDVEGHEAAVLAGARSILEDHPPAFVVMEIQGSLLAHAGASPEDLVAQLESLGYVPVDGDGSLGRREVARPLPADFFETVVFARSASGAGFTSRT